MVALLAALLVANTRFLATERHYTLADLDALAAGLAAELHQQGVRAGHRVAVMSSNRPEFVVALRALWRLGAAAVFGFRAMMRGFGDQRMREWIDEHGADEDRIYAHAIDTLVKLHSLPPGPFELYDMAVYQREVDLFVDWYCPAVGLSVDRETWTAAWDEALAPLLKRQNPGVTVLRDYHAENIMLLEPGTLAGEQGLIDFQDALVGHPAYDLVSLLQDARRDVPQQVEQDMLDRYRAATDSEYDFVADYARLGAQRNAKIVGIFTRLYKRDGKDRYLGMIPRVWQALERDLAHEAMAPVARWFAENIPQELRDAGGGTIS